MRGTYLSTKRSLTRELGAERVRFPSSRPSARTSANQVIQTASETSALSTSEQVVHSSSTIVTWTLCLPPVRHPQVVPQVVENSAKETKDRTDARTPRAPLGKKPFSG